MPIADWNTLTTAWDALTPEEKENSNFLLIHIPNSSGANALLPHLLFPKVLWTGLRQDAVGWQPSHTTPRPRTCPGKSTESRSTTTVHHNKL